MGGGGGCHLLMDKERGGGLCLVRGWGSAKIVLVTSICK